MKELYGSILYGLGALPPWVGCLGSKAESSPSSLLWSQRFKELIIRGACQVSKDVHLKAGLGVEGDEYGFSPRISVGDCHLVEKFHVKSH